MELANIRISDWDGYEKQDFEFNGRNGLIVLPKEFAPGRPWVWRAEFFGAFDYVDRDLLAKGYPIAYYATCDMYGCPTAVRLMKQFHDMLVEKYSLNQKASLFGFSRGGLYTVNYAAAYPEDIAVIYLDAPVCDIKSWPGPFGKGGGDSECWEECKGYYGVTDENVKDFKGNPVDKIEVLVKNKIPCVLCAGLDDNVVPYDENGMIFAKKYSSQRGWIKTILKHGCGHHPHSLMDPEEISDFIQLTNN